MVKDCAASSFCKHRTSSAATEQAGIKDVPHRACRGRTARADPLAGRERRSRPCARIRGSHRTAAGDSEWSPPPRRTHCMCALIAQRMAQLHQYKYHDVFHMPSMSRLILARQDLCSLSQRQWAALQACLLCHSLQLPRLPCMPMQQGPRAANALMHSSCVLKPCAEFLSPP